MNGWRCPDWCAKGHQCTVQQGSPAGVHSSGPMRWNAAYGSLVAVRFQDLDGRNWLELRGHVRLGDTGLPIQEQASRLAVHVDQAIRAIALPATFSRPAMVRKRQTR